MLKIHEEIMREAYKLAQSAAEGGDVPVGAVVVRDGKIIGRGQNMRQRIGDPSAHAEILALREASKAVGSWNLSGCSLYVTMEPCPMCAGAVIVSRIDNVYFGAYDKELGCCGTLYNLPEDCRMNHRANVYGGIMEKECSKILTDFFKSKRQNSI
jgi:tRNA(adenine34) deaminase